MAAGAMQKNIFLKTILLFFVCIVAINVFAQDDDAEIKTFYSPPVKNNYTVNDDSVLLVKIKESDLDIFIHRFQHNILRRLNKQWFVINNVFSLQLQQLQPLHLYPANNNYKISTPVSALQNTDKNVAYTFIIHVTDSDLFKADMQLYHQHIVSSYKNAFIIKARISYITDTLINKPFIQSVGLRIQRPTPETVINEYDYGVNAINLFYSKHASINADSLTVSVKENLFDTTDIDFKNRYVHSNVMADTVSSHATTMATIIAGGGNSFQSGRGVAWGASVSSSDFANLLPDDDSYFNQYYISVQNNSYGVGVEDFYGADAAAYDKSMADNPFLLFVFSSGNSGNVTPADGNYKNIAGFSNLTGSFKQAKNIITSGSVDSFYNVPALSSKGPAYDGRIKPEVVAYGNDGSSGAAAITSGTVLAIQAAYQSVHHDSLPQNALAKAIVINSADDVFNPGPDFYSGFGNVNTNNAVSDALTNNFFTGNVMQDETKNFFIHVPANTSNLKITLVWNDVANSPNAFKALVNDLDIWLENANDHTVYLPWVLNAAANETTLLSNATRGRDSLNNIEQITIATPAGGDYIIHVKGYAVTQGAQPFYIAYRVYAANDFNFVTPVNNAHFTGGKGIFRWSSTFASNRGKLEYSFDKGNTWVPISNNVNLSKKYYKWAVPDTNVVVLARMTISDKTFYSDTFDISTQVSPTVGFNCGDSALIYWNKQKGAAGYAIYNLGDKYLQPVITTTDTFYIVNNTFSKYFAVAPVFGNHAGLKSYTFNYATQGVGCYISNFLADPDGNNASLKLYLGTVFNIKNISFQQQLKGEWTNLSTVAPVNNLEVSYSSPLQAGVNIFRAIITLNNGSVIISNEAIVYYLNDKQYIIFPNPAVASKGFKVLSQNVFSATIIVFDVAGKKMIQQKITQQSQQINTSQLAKGIYFIIVYDDENKQAFRTKIIIQ